MELKYRGGQTARFIAETRSGSAVTGERMGFSGGAALDRSVLIGGQNGAHRSPLQDRLTGRRLFMLGVDSLADLEAGRVQLG